MLPFSALVTMLVALRGSGSCFGSSSRSIRSSSKRPPGMVTLARLACRSSREGNVVLHSCLARCCLLRFLWRVELVCEKLPQSPSHHNLFDETKKNYTEMADKIRRKCVMLVERNTQIRTQSRGSGS